MKAQAKQVRNIILSIILPMFIGGFVALLVGNGIRKTGYLIDSDHMSNVITTVIGIWGTILGFIISAESILIGFNGSGRIHEISQTRHYRIILYTYLITCCNLLLCLVIFIPIIILKYFSIFIFCLFVMAIVISLIDVGLCIFYLGLMLIASFKD